MLAQTAQLEELYAEFAQALSASIKASKPKRIKS
jgi:hypothetical protein